MNKLDKIVGAMYALAFSLIVAAIIMIFMLLTSCTATETVYEPMYQQDEGALYEQTDTNWIKR